MSQRVYSVAVPAEAGNLAMVRAFFEPLVRKTCGADGESVTLALDEACANVVKHRCRELGDGMIRVRAELAPGRLRFRIGRFCRPQDLPAIKPRDPGEVRPGGLGTSFIEQLMDRVAFEDETDRPGSVALVLEKTLAERPDR